MRYRSICRAIFAQRSPRFSRILGVSTALVLSVGLLGCGQENELGRLPFSGTVTLDGKPIERGSISFEPTGDDGVRSGATITGGKFTVDEMDGLPAGTYLVRINASSGTPGAAEDQPPGMSQVMAKELIPPKYNAESQETITIEEGGENQFTFDIKTTG